MAIRLSLSSSRHSNMMCLVLLVSASPYPHQLHGPVACLTRSSVLADALRHDLTLPSPQYESFLACCYRSESRFLDHAMVNDTGGSCSSALAAASFASSSAALFPGMFAWPLIQPMVMMSSQSRHWPHSLLQYVSASTPPNASLVAPLKSLPPPTAPTHDVAPTPLAPLMCASYSIGYPHEIQGEKRIFSFFFCSWGPQATSRDTFWVGGEEGAP